MTIIAKDTEISEDHMAQEDTPSPQKPFADLFGVLKDKQIYEDNGVELQRQWRDEWNDRAYESHF